MTIALIDCGIGNLRSVQKAFEYVGADVKVTDKPDDILASWKVVLPGVGAFGEGMKGLAQRGLVEVVQEVVRVGIPLLGICVGMQVLFEQSEEMGVHVGLGVLEGRVRRFVFEVLPNSDDFNRQTTKVVTTKDTLKVPQTGWNKILPQRDSILFRNLPAGSFAYFNHSYYCDATAQDTLATTDYGIKYASVVGRGRVYGIQFHPEKSQSVGLKLLRNFVELG